MKPRETANLHRDRRGPREVAGDPVVIEGISSTSFWAQKLRELSDSAFRPPAGFVMFEGLRPGAFSIFARRGAGSSSPPRSQAAFDEHRATGAKPLPGVARPGLLEKTPRCSTPWAEPHSAERLTRAGPASHAAGRCDRSSRAGIWPPTLNGPWRPHRFRRVTPFRWPPVDPLNPNLVNDLTFDLEARRGASGSADPRARLLFVASSGSIRRGGDFFLCWIAALDDLQAAVEDTGDATLSRGDIEQMAGAERPHPLRSTLFFFSPPPPCSRSHQVFFCS